MQGARSTRGCVSCRKRKKGCDLQTPSCGRCQRLNIDCTYEGRQWTFLHHQSTSSSAGIFAIDQEPGTASIRSSPPVAGPLPSRSLNRTDLTLLYDAKFWDIYLPNEHPNLDGSVGGVTTASWIHTVRKLAQTDSNVYSALQACVFAGIGSSQSDQDFLRQGTHLYAQALRGVNDALQDPVLALDDSVLACCRILSLFELFQRSNTAMSNGQSQPQDWRKHVEGTCRIVSLRGRERHESACGVDLYDGVRSTAVIHGIMSRMPNNFTLLSWTLPARTLKDTLWNIAGSFPLILQQMDRKLILLKNEALMEDASAFIIHQSQEIIEQCIAIGAELQEFETSALSLCRAQRTTPQDDDKSGHVMIAYQKPSSLSEECRSHGFGFFFLCMQYWAFSITLYSAVVQFHSQLSFLLDDQHVVTLPTWLNPEPHALNIASHASHFFTPQAGLWSAQCATHPIIAALGYFAGTGRRNYEEWKMITNAFADHPFANVLKRFL